MFHTTIFLQRTREKRREEWKKIIVGLEKFNSKGRKTPNKRERECGFYIEYTSLFFRGSKYTVREVQNILLGRFKIYCISNIIFLISKP